MSRSTNRNTSNRAAGALAPSLAVLGAAIMVTPAFAQAPSLIIMPGIVRDFQRAHPDFDVTPSGGFGHYANNVALNLGADGKPVFAGTGFRVDGQWTDQKNQPIAPHLFLSASTIFVDSAPSLNNFPVRGRFFRQSDGHHSSFSPCHLSDINFTFPRHCTASRDVRHFPNGAASATRHFEPPILNIN